VAREAAWTCLHLTTYPLGLLREGTQASDRYHLDGLGPAQRGLLVHDVEAAGTPILLVHGMIDNRAIFAVLKHRLRRKGLRTIASMNYPLNTNDIRRAARELGGVVEALAERTGYEQIHVIGHSMGGLIARYYVQRLGGDRPVHTLVTLGTPHAGRRTATGGRPYGSEGCAEPVDAAPLEHAVAERPGDGPSQRQRQRPHAAGVRPRHHHGSRRLIRTNASRAVEKGRVRHEQRPTASPAQLRCAALPSS